jgi:signal transduction histidine kinase
MKKVGEAQGEPRRRWVSLTVWLAIAVAAVSVILAAAVGWVSDGAMQLGRVDAALRSAELSRVQLTTALLMAEQAELGLVPTDILAQATGAARSGLARFEADVSQLPEQEVAADAYLDAAGALLAALESADEVDFRPLLEAAGPPLEGVVAALQNSQSEQLRQLAALKSRSAPIMLIAAFVVVLGGPLAIIGAHQAWLERRLAAGRLRQELLANQEILQSKNEFLANVSHELRTPLTGIYGLTRLLEQGEPDPREREELVGLISQESTELLRMIDDILTLGRSDAGVLNFQPEILDPAGEIAPVLEPFERQRGPIRLDFDGSLIWADPLRLRQLIRNLVSNAHRHGGVRIEILGRGTVDGFEVVVRDNGAGVPDHLLDSLFSRYLHRKSTPLLAGSIGLGLHIARLLAEGMGGRLAYRKADIWTEFMVILPLAKAEAPIREALIHAG